jgi:hypothetical protein
MKHYTVYNESGEIIKFGQTSSNDLSIIQLDDGMQIAELQCPQDAHLYKVSNGEIEKKSDAEISDTNRPRDLAIFRGGRDELLKSSDWTQAADSPLTDAKKAEWATYRQQLRDLPANTSDPANPTWPTPPS